MKLLSIILLCFSASALADNITLQLSSEYGTNNGKKICEYSNSMYDFTLTLKDFQDCPLTKTFDNDGE